MSKNKYHTYYVYIVSPFFLNDGALKNRDRNELDVKKFKTIGFVKSDS